MKWCTGEVEGGVLTTCQWHVVPLNNAHGCTSAAVGRMPGAAGADTDVRPGIRTMDGSVK